MHTSGAPTHSTWGGAGEGNLRQREGVRGKSLGARRQRSRLHDSRAWEMVVALELAAGTRGPLTAPVDDLSTQLLLKFLSSWRRLVGPHKPGTDAQVACPPKLVAPLPARASSPERASRGSKRPALSCAA